MNKKLLLTVSLVAFFASAGFALANLAQVELQPQSSFTCNATGTIYYSLSNNQLMLCTSGSASSPVLTSSGSSGTGASFSTLTVSGTTTLATGSGSVGIGTTNASAAKLVVNGGVDFSQPGGEVDVTRNPSTSPYSPLVFRFANGPTANSPGIKFQTSNNGNLSSLSDRLVINTDTASPYAYFANISGLGINTSTPATTLDVNGNINVGSVLYDRANTNYYINPSGNIMPYAANLSGSINVTGGGNFGSSVNITSGSDINNTWTANGEGSWRLILGATSTGYGAGAGGFGIYNNTDALYHIVFHNNGSTSLGGTYYMPGSGVWNSSGNVGIGTTNPYSSLEVLSGSNTQGLSFFTSSYDSSRQYGTRIYTHDDSGGIPLYFDWQSGSTWNTLFRIGSNSADSNKVETFGQTALASTGGNVGIGTITPTTAGLVVATNVSGAAIDVNNNRIINVGTPVNAADAATKSYVDSAITGGGASGSLSTLTVTGTTTLATNGTSHVGIGTMAPATLLDLFASQPDIQLSPSNYGTTSYNSYFGSQSSAVGILQLGNNGQNYIVAGNTNTGGYLNFVVNNTNAFPNTPNGTTAMVLDATGHLSIMPTSNATYSLSVNGTSDSGNSGVALLGSSTGQPIIELLQRSDGSSNTGAVQMWRGNPRESSPRIYLTAGTSNSYINSGGYLGINTNSPGTNLDVNGNINVGYTLYDKSNSNYYVNPSANVMPYSANLAGGINLGTARINVPTSFNIWYSGASDSANLVEYAYADKGDALRWRTPYLAETYIGGVWSTWSSPPNFADLTAGLSYTYFSVPNSIPEFRLSYNVAACDARILRIMQTYIEVTYNVTVEYSSNGSTWTTATTATGLTGGQSIVVLPPDGCTGYYRFTFTVTNYGSSTTFNLSNIQLLDIRPGNQGGGFQTLFPFSWDVNRNMSFPGTGTQYFAGNVGIKTTNTPYALSVSGSMYSVEVDNGTATGATTINWSSSNMQTLVLGANIALTFSNGEPGAHYTLALKQDGTGSRTVTWPGNVRWSSGVAPTLTTTANKTDYVEFVYDGLSSTFDGVGFNANF